MLKPSSQELSTAPVSMLPRFIAIKGDNGLYLSLKPNGFLTFDAPTITRLETHEVLYNVDDPGATFIIRSQNQRFWRRDMNNRCWIWADRDAGSPPSATDHAARFKLATIVSSSGKLAFQSAADDLYLNRLLEGAMHGYSALEKVPNKWSQVEVSDACVFAISLPQYIFIKGDNGKYLHTANIRDLEWLKFHGSTPANPYGTSEVIPLLDGSLMFYSLQTLKAWRNSTNWIWADASKNDALTNTRCHFEPIKLSSSMLALRNKFNNLICKRLTDYWESSLNAGAHSTADICTHLTISEATLGRHVFNIKYLLNLASVTDQKPLAVAYGSTVNNSSYTTDMTVSVTITQDVSSSYVFSNSFTFSQTVSTTFKAGIPFVVDGELQVSLGFEQSFSKQWGETTSKGIQINNSFVVKDVPPGGQASVRIVCNSAKMRIPFTYTCKDTAPDGTDRQTLECVDGIFEGIDVYNTEAEISNSSTTHKMAVKNANMLFAR